MNNATTFTYDASAANRSAYAGQLLLTKNHTASTDSWETGLNNNVLVLGCSGGGKTRNHLKPNLMQCQGSYVVLDTKGSLYYEMGPYLRSRGYKVDLLDFTRDGEGSVGYDPLSYIRWSWGHPCTQDIITVASAIVRQTRWTATRFGLALPPTTSQATSPMSWRHYPKKSATWPRLCVFSSRREGGRRASFLRTLSTTVRKAMPSPFSIVRR